MTKKKVNWSQCYYKIKNPEKYAGKIIENKHPFAKSSWELTFMRFCDENDNIISWVYEPVKIPYFNPIKNKQSIYIPDFLIYYKDKNGEDHVEMIEIKPREQFMESKKTSKKEKADIIVNRAKWKAAATWCKHNNVVFRVVAKEDIYR